MGSIGNCVRKGSLGAAVLCAAALLAGCGGSGGTTTVKLQNSYGTAHGPVANVTWALPYGEPNTIDPANGAYFSSSFVTSQMCDTLLRLGPDYSVSPNLATQKRVDPLTIVYNLRKGVRFWDGHEMTSDDVVYSLRHNFSPLSVIGAIFTSVKSVVATGRYQVTIHFRVPDERFTKEMPAFASAIFEKAHAIKAGGKFGTAQGGIMCSGPFELQHWTPGRSLVLTANPHYWNPARAASIKKVTFVFATNSTTLAASLLSGQVDGAYEVPADVIPRLSKASNGRLLFGPASLYLSLSPLHNSGSLGNVKLREALMTSIDRPALAHVVYHDAAIPNYTALNQRTWDPAGLAIYKAAYRPFEQAGKTWGTAPALAAGKKLVAQSGYKGQPLSLVTLAGDQTLNKAAELVQQQAKQVGINIKIKALQPIPYANVGAVRVAQRGYDLYMAMYYDGARDPLEPLLFSVLPESPYDYTQYNDPTVSRLVATANRTFDPIKRAKMIVKAQSIYQKAWLGTILVSVDEISFLNNRLSGLTTSGPYLLGSSFWSVGAAG